MLEFHTLSGPEFEVAVRGKLNDQYRIVEPAWLEPPKLHYFYERSCLVRGPDTRVFVLATAPAQGKRRQARSVTNPGAPKRRAVGMLEVDVHAGDATTVGIKYVTVHPDFKKQGLAIRLYGLLIEYLKARDLKLYRTRPGKDTPERFTLAVTRLLEAQGIRWTVREY